MAFQKSLLTSVNSSARPTVDSNLERARPPRSQGISLSIRSYFQDNYELSISEFTVARVIARWLLDDDVLLRRSKSLGCANRSNPYDPNGNVERADCVFARTMGRKLTSKVGERVTQLAMEAERYISRALSPTRKTGEKRAY